jgi:phosphocarrier protein HPr
VTRHSVQILNKLGLHARAAARFVHVANRFRSRINVSRGGKTVDGKSILGILLLAAAQGSWLELVAEGEDEGAMIDALVSLVERGFEESA